MGDTGDTDATPSAAAAYRELADGLRDLATTVSSGQLPAAEPVTAADPAPVERSSVVELLRAGVRGAVEVATCSALLAALLILAFNLWVSVNPPARF
jgi:hypothetical protein